MNSTASSRPPAPSPSPGISPGISIVIPNWNGERLLQRFFPSVAREAERMRRETGVPVEMVVCDDGSTDGSVAWLAAAWPQARVVRLSANQGFAPAANAGIAAARFEIVALLNSDVEVLPGALAALPAWFDDPACFGVALRASDIGIEELPPRPVFSSGGKRGRFRRGFWEVWDNFDRLPGGEARGAPTFYLPGGFAALRRGAFLALGGFDPLFAPYYWEDVDLSYRARKAGWTMGYEPAAMVYHARSATVARHRTALFRQAVIHRNRLQFHWLNLDGGRLAQHLLWCHLMLLQMPFRGDFAYYSGYWQALRRVGRIAARRRRERPGWRRRDAELGVLGPPEPAR